jgi:hypothetical protein
MTETQKIIKYCAIALAVVLIVAIIGGILQAVGLLRLIFSRGEDSVGEMKAYEVTGDVRNLKISVSAAVLEIRTGDAFAVESNYKKLSVECDGGDLTIKTAKQTDRLVFFGNYETATVILTVPEEFSFERIHIEAGAGDMKIAGLTAERFRMELGAGNVEIDRLNVAEKTEIEGGTGNLSLVNATLHDLDMGIGVGQVTVEALFLGDSEIDCGVGKADISLLGDPSDYSIAVEKGLGAATVNGKSVSDDEALGNGKNRLEIHGGVGEISVRTNGAE